MQAHLIFRQMGLLPLPSARRVLSAACLSFSLFLAAGCVPQQLTRAPADSGPQTAASKASTTTASKPAEAPAPAPRRSILAPTVAIPIKRVEASSNAEQAQNIFTDRNSSHKNWVSERGDTARWVKIHFDGLQALHELRFKARSNTIYTLSFSDGSRQTVTTEPLEESVLVPLGGKKAEWIAIQYHANRYKSRFGNKSEASMFLHSLSITGVDRNASPKLIQTQTTGDDQMPFEAGSFVWKGGREGLGDIPMFLSRGKAFVVADSGLYSFTDAMSWCEGLSETTGMQWRRIWYEEFSEISSVCNRANSFCHFSKDFERYLQWMRIKMHLPGDFPAYTLFDRGPDHYAIMARLEQPRVVKFIGRIYIKRSEIPNLHYRPFCVAQQDLGNAVSRRDPKDPHVADIQSVVRVVARNNLLAKCAAGDKLAVPVKASVSLTRGEFEKTADFERRKQNAEREAELAYQQALKKRAQAQNSANADCEKEKQTQGRGWGIQYSAAVLNALTGYPQIRSAVYDADAEVFNLQIGGSEVSSLIPFAAPVKIKYAEDFKKMLLAKDFKPTVHVRVDNAGIMRIAHIEELQNPEDRVVNAAWAAAQGNVNALYNFIAKFPEDKKRVAEARQQIDNIQKAHARAEDAAKRLLGGLILKAGEAIREDAEWRRQHCKYVRVDGVEHEICER
jgi:hypothetical protein